MSGGQLDRCPEKKSHCPAPTTTLTVVEYSLAASQVLATNKNGSLVMSRSSLWFEALPRWSLKHTHCGTIPMFSLPACREHEREKHIVLIPNDIHCPMRLPYNGAWYLRRRSQVPLGSSGVSVVAAGKAS